MEKDIINANDMKVRANKNYFSVSLTIYSRILFKYGSTYKPL